ncbi:MAG: FAD-dependent oxidoreductase [Acidimicrobiia bacterium]|nr:FAD-dependent oxidoreductase [Acidimicrobiia bacterium]
MDIAIIGSGIAGLGAAHRLHKSANITLFEAGAWVGGHAHTVDVELDGRHVPIDTGFIVYNEHTYPLLTSLFEELHVETEASDMSFAIGGGPVEYEGSTRGMAAQPASLARPGHLRMIYDILAFNRRARILASRGVPPDLTVGDLIAPYGKAFRDRYLLPIGAAIWSTPEADMAGYPAATFIRFFANHGLLQVRNRPQWRTVTRGARSYVEALTTPFLDRVHTNTPVRRVDRSASGVTVFTDTAEYTYDAVVLATHADTSLAMLGADATAEEQAVLGSFGYSTNDAVLHTDPALMPSTRKAWASWNVLEGDARSVPSVTYWMNRLQNLEGTDVFVTLNPAVEPNGILGRWSYDHPMFDRAAIAAQGRLPRLQGTKRTYYAGAYFRYGFHEDGLMSGYAAADALLTEHEELLV